MSQIGGTVKIHALDTQIACLCRGKSAHIAIIVNANRFLAGLIAEAIFRTADRIVFIGARFNGGFIRTAAVIRQHMRRGRQAQCSANQARKQ